MQYKKGKSVFFIRKTNNVRMPFGVEVYPISGKYSVAKGIWTGKDLMFSKRVASLTSRTKAIAYAKKIIR